MPLKISDPKTIPSFTHCISTSANDLEW